MPIRGENIGTAYVRILADGDGLDESIRQAFDDAEPSVREGGEHHADAYSESFDKQYRKSFKGNFGKLQRDLFAESNKALTESMVRLKLADNFFRSSEWKKFRERLRNEAGDAGDLAGKRLEEKFRDSANLGGLAGAMASIGPQIRRAQADLLREMAQVEKESLAERDRNLRNFFKGQQQGYQALLDAQMKARLDADREFEAAHRLAADAARDRAEEERRLQVIGLAQTRAIEEDRRRTIQGLVSDYADLSHQLTLVAQGSREATSSHRQVIEGLRHLRRRAVEANVELQEVSHTFNELELRARLLTPGLSRLSDRLETFADTAGRAFGRGSRNDFLNFFGSVIRNVLSLTKLVPTLLAGAVRIGRTFSGAFLDAGGGLKGLIAGFGSLIPVLTSVAAGLAAFGVMVGALVLIIGPLISLISGLVGIITALAGSLVFALAGGLVAVAGAFGPVIVGAGLLAAAINRVDPKRLKDDFQPLIRDLKDLGDIAADEIFGDIGTQVEQFRSALRGAGDTVRELSESVRGVFDGWADDLDSPAFRRWVRQMGEEVPPMIESLGNILSNTLGGIGGFFIAASPFIRRFLDWLEGITQQFQDWANSAGGRKEIRDFLERAADSAESLGGFLEEAGGFLLDLIDPGKKTGDNIFDSMADAIAGWREDLEKNPDILKDWFADAELLAGSLGDAADAIGRLMDELDDEESRETIRDLIDLFTLLTGIIRWTASAFKEEFITPFVDFQKHIEDFEETLQGWTDFDFKLPDLNTRGFGRAMTTEFAGLGPKIAQKIGKIDLTNFIKGAAKAEVGLVSTFNKTKDRVLDKIGRPNLANFIIGVETARRNLIDEFNGAKQKILDKIGKPNVQNIIVGAGIALVDLVNTFERTKQKILDKIGKVDVSNIITGADNAIERLLLKFAGLGAKILNQIGHIDLSSLMHGRLDPPGPLGPWEWAEGGVADRPMIRKIGEDGPEAVVPLNRPLSKVDPSVRRLSAFAQGLDAGVGMVPAGPSKVIDASGWQIITPTNDSRAVATEVVNRLVAVSY